MANTENQISVVIPVYKSAEILPELLRRLETVLPTISPDYQVILVNDCSPDNSWQVLEELSTDNVHIKAVNLRKNTGYDNAIMAGLSFVDNEYTVIMDDDLQHSPEDIPAMLEAIKEGHDTVYAKFPEKKQTLIKNLGSWANDKLANFIINKPARIYLSPFKIIRKGVIDEIIKYTGPFTYVDGLIFQTTDAIHQIMVEHNTRASGAGNHGIIRSLRIMLNFCTTFSIFPLRLSAFLGLAMSGVAVICTVILFIAKLCYGVDMEGWTSLMLTIIVMGGVQLVILGVLGEYLGRTYINLNNRPQYIIKKVI